MRVVLQFIVLSFLLMACSRRDASVHDRIIGSWVHGDSGEITLLPNGSFHSKWTIALTNVTQEWIYDGTWGVKEGVLISTVTNSSANNTTNSQAIGSIDRFKIIQLDSIHLAIDIGQKTNLFNRR